MPAPYELLHASWQALSGTVTERLEQLNTERLEQYGPVPPPRWMPHTYMSLSAAPPHGVGVDVVRRLIFSVRGLALIDPLVDEMQYRLRGKDDGVPINDPAVIEMFEAMAASNELPLTEEDVEAIVAMGCRTWAEKHFGRALSREDVERAGIL